MKSYSKIFSVCLCLLLSSILVFGCSKNNTKTQNTNINIKGIYLTSSNASNSNVYDINFLKIEILDFKTNNSFTIYKGDNLSYQIQKPKPFMVENDYLLPNEKSVINIEDEQFKLLVSLSIDYDGKEIKFSDSATIRLNYTDGQLNLKNINYDSIIASLLNFSFKLNNGQQESISLILNAEEIKN